MIDKCPDNARVAEIHTQLDAGVRSAAAVPKRKKLEVRVRIKKCRQRAQRNFLNFWSLA